MTQQVINVGTVANDGTGDPLRTAFIKVNANFAEVYTFAPKDTGGNPIPAASKAELDAGLALKANIDSPTLTGDPKAPTPPPGDADTSIATTAFVSAAISGIGSGGGTAGLGNFGPPQGRLTLQSNTPVMISPASGSTVIYYTPYIGNKIPIFDGSVMNMTAFTQVIGDTTDTTKNPGAVAPNSIQDWFVWNDAGTIWLCHGPQWTSNTLRAPTSGDIERVAGLWVNHAAIANGPAAQRGTYVGTTFADANAKLSWVQGSRALGGGAGFLYVWNAYNRVATFTQVTEATGNWVPAANTLVVWRPLNSSVGNRISYVAGLAEDVLLAAIYQPIGAIVGSWVGAAIGFDSVNTASGPTGFALVPAVSFFCELNAANILNAAMGAHYVQSLEWVYSAGHTFYGDQTQIGPASGGNYGVASGGLQLSLRM